MTGYVPKHGFCLTIGDNPSRKRPAKPLLAVVTDGSPQLGHKDVEVLTLETFDTCEQAREWYKEVIVTQPWMTRQ